MKIHLSPEEAESYAKILAEDTGGDSEMSYSQRVDTWKAIFLKDGILPEVRAQLERELHDH